MSGGNRLELSYWLEASVPVGITRSGLLDALAILFQLLLQLALLFTVALLDVAIQLLLLQRLILLHLLQQPLLAADAVFKLLLLGRYLLRGGLRQQRQAQEQHQGRYYFHDSSGETAVGYRFILAVNRGVVPAFCDTIQVCHDSGAALQTIRGASPGWGVSVE
ncbi:hypothetical protein NM75_14715 [Dickeya fangzhongdai]|nr:hypothetical protein LH89_13425 [Dickeya fangzhongdai]KGT97437.1 hypothetical protein NM75_14715 [Dickeya fangzhongdai]